MNLIVKNISKTFHSGNLLFGRRREVQALYQVSMNLKSGISLGIVGESGSGKTTLAKILAGFLPADSGKAGLGNHNLLEMNRRERAPLVQMVFQDPMASLNPKLLLRTQLNEALRKGKAVDLMQSVGLSPLFLDRYPHQISGGQRQRFAIARALAVQPRLLIADEPVSSLDVSVQAQIINLLNSLRRFLKFSLIVISHDLAVIANCCEEAAVMKDGRLVEEGSVEKILSRPSHAVTKQLLKASPSL